MRILLRNPSNLNYAPMTDAAHEGDGSYYTSNAVVESALYRTVVHAVWMDIRKSGLIMKLQRPETL